MANVLGYEGIAPSRLFSSRCRFQSEDDAITFSSLAKKIMTVEQLHDVICGGCFQNTEFAVAVVFRIQNLLHGEINSKELEFPIILSYTVTNQDRVAVIYAFRCAISHAFKNNRYILLSSQAHRNCQQNKYMLSHSAFTFISGLLHV